MFKWILSIIFIVVLGAGFYYIYDSQSGIPNETICTMGNPLYTDYCDDIGKTAYRETVTGVINYGKITGVAWRTRGSQIQTLGSNKRVSDRDEYYYIITKDGGETTTLERVSLIKTK